MSLDRIGLLIIGLTIVGLIGLTFTIVCADGRSAAAAPFNPCGPSGAGVRDDVLVYGPNGSTTWSVRWECPEKPADWEPFPCGGKNGPCTP